MATREILIGREVPAGNFIVPGDARGVSRRHAKLIVDGSEYMIVDTDSANGTYVGGVSVKSKVVKANDVIELGAPNGYKVIVGDILGTVGIKSDSGYKHLNPTDEFNQKVMSLGSYYYDYKREVKELTAKMQSDSMIKRMGPGMLLGVVTSLLGATVEDDMKVPLLVIGGVLTIIVFIVANKWAAKSSLALRERIDELNAEYDMKFECPDCHTSWKAHTFDWYVNKGGCPACKKGISISDYQLAQLQGS